MLRGALSFALSCETFKFLLLVVASTSIKAGLERRTTAFHSIVPILSSSFQPSLFFSYLFFIPSFLSQACLASSMPKLSPAASIDRTPNSNRAAAADLSYSVSVVFLMLPMVPSHPNVCDPAWAALCPAPRRMR
jgi:hypothetical protein